MRYERTADDRCTLIGEPVGEVLPCRLRARSLVARANADGSVVWLAGVCSNPGVARTELVAVRLGGDPLRTMVFSKEILPAVPSSRVTQPVMANLDGQGLDVVALDSTERNGVHLFVWAPLTNTSTNVALPGITMTLAPQETMAGPIVIGGRELELVLVAGYGGANGLVAWLGGRPTFVPLEVVPEPSRRAPALALADPPVLADVRANEVRFTELQLGNSRAPALGAVRSSPLIAGVDRDLSARLAIARVGDEARLQAVLTEDGIVELHPLDGTPATSFDAWGGGIQGAQHTLLWNMDGRDGAEIVTYDTGTRDLHGNASSGRALDGWDPLSATQQSEDVTVALAKIGGANDLDLDVIILAGEMLEVITLGPNSAASREFAWPQPNHDASATGTWFENARDPVVGVQR